VVGWLGFGNEDGRDVKGGRGSLLTSSPRRLVYLSLPSQQPTSSASSRRPLLVPGGACCARPDLLEPLTRQPCMLLAIASLEASKKAPSEFKTSTNLLKQSSHAPPYLLFP
jgi:hypothetical protein